jgi:CHAT domain-containing protein
VERLLSASDVSGRDILDPELLVLSACESSLGQVLASEGSSACGGRSCWPGSRRWSRASVKVPDQQTQELMVDFYHRLMAGEGRTEALRQAQLAMKAKYPDPFDWGAFICQGDPGPLKAIEPLRSELVVPG